MDKMVRRDFGIASAISDVAAANDSYELCIPVLTANVAVRVFDKLISCGVGAAISG
jgi:hypothetical protein